MGTFLNDDNLYQKYGRSEGSSLVQAGTYCQYGNSNYAEINLDLTLLTEVEQIINDVFVIPDNCLIEKVMVKTLVAAATGTAIDVGLVHTSRDTADAEFTADPDGLLAAADTAGMDTVGQTVWFFESGTENTAVVLGTGTAAQGGDLIGDLTTAPCLITASRTDSTAFTAGKIVLGIWYRPAAVSGFASS